MGEGNVSVVVVSVDGSSLLKVQLVCAYESVRARETLHNQQHPHITIRNKAIMSKNKSINFITFILIVVV